jgi:serine/threonine protein kinase
VTSADRPLLRFAVTSDAAVRITVYGATGSKLGMGHGTVVLSLARGLYRVHLERCGFVRERLVDHEQETTLHDPGPPLQTPVPLAGAATSRDYYCETARKLSMSETCRPLGDSPHSGRLFLFIRWLERNVCWFDLPSEPVTIHDLAGHKLATLSRDTARLDDELGYIAFSAQVAPGTYRIRAVRSRRELAVTIPENRAAHVFIADTGVVRLDDLRVALTDRDQPFDPESHVAHAMESLLAALKVPEPVFPPDARLLLPEAVDQDLCFGIAVAHQLWRCQDEPTFDQVVQRLMPYANLPDIAILAQLRVRTERGLPPLRGQGPFAAPPLMRASLVMAMTRPELDLSTVSPDGVIARAAGAGLHDSIWCTWSTRAWDDRWIAPTIESLRSRDNIPPASLARLFGLPPRTVERAINELDSKLPLVNGSPTRAVDLRVPGYAIGEILGHGAQGTVFRATRVVDGQPVALKVIPLVDGREQRARIEQDLERIKGLSHPGVLVYSDWGALPNDAGLWFDMELCRGSVFDLLSTSDEPLPFARSCQIVLEALDALDRLHSEGIVHGNIKPSNLLVRANDSVVIADFGLAKHLLHDGQISVTSRTAGTMHFTPRERFVDFKRSVPASDVWSMAATLYFLLTRDFPRDRYADQSVLDAAFNNPIVPIAERWAEVPGEFAHCIDRALSDDIHVRPRDAAQLRKEMTAALAIYDPATPNNSQLPKDATEARDAPLSAPAELSSDSLLPVRPLALSRRSLDTALAVRPKLRVLVVDDDPDAAETACMLLAMFGHDCRVATCGEDALLVAAQFNPDVVILDTELPDISGLELARRLRLLFAGRPLYLAAVTGWGQPEDRVKAFAAGFDYHVIMPADREELSKILELAVLARDVS